MKSLKPCPCGQTPKELDIQHPDYTRFGFATPTCCNEWTIEFRHDYSNGDELKAKAIEAWNNAPRSTS